MQVAGDSVGTAARRVSGGPVVGGGADGVRHCRKSSWPELVRRHTWLPTISGDQPAKTEKEKKPPQAPAPAAVRGVGVVGGGRRRQEGRLDGGTGAVRLRGPPTVCPEGWLRRSIPAGPGDTGGKWARRQPKASPGLNGAQGSASCWRRRFVPGSAWELASGQPCSGSQGPLGVRLGLDDPSRPTCALHGRSSRVVSAAIVSCFDGAGIPEVT